MYSIMSSANSDSFASSFPIWIPLNAFSSLIFVARSSKTMLSDSSKSGHPCLVPDLRGNAFSFSLLRVMFPLNLSYIALVAQMVKVSAYNVGDPGSIPGSERSPGEGNGNPLQYSFLPGKSHGRKSLVGYSPWGRKESDTTEQLHFLIQLISDIVQI